MKNKLRVEVEDDLTQESTPVRKCPLTTSPNVNSTNALNCSDTLSDLIITFDLFEIVKLNLNMYSYRKTISPSDVEDIQTGN